MTISLPKRSLKAACILVGLAFGLAWSYLVIELADRLALVLKSFYL